jgi:hypothetical protein
MGPKGDKGDTGPKGEQGPPGQNAIALRVVSLGASDCSSGGCTIACKPDEVIAAAVCLGDSAKPPAVQAGSAKCGVAIGMNALCAQK